MEDIKGMKRTLKYALSAVLVGAIVAPAFAQDNFPDVPANHWAFEALARLKKDGILVGYPDGLYRGGRPASRYELAAAVHAAYVNLKNQADGLSTQIQALNDKIGNGAVTKADLDNIKAALAALQSQVDGMKGWGDDIASLKKMAGEFQKELQSMGVDVEGLKKGLGDLGSRVSALEKRKLPVDISGGLDLLMLGGYSTSGDFGITVDGRITGYGRGSYDGQAVGITRDLTMMHEASLTLTGTNDTGPKWHGTVVMGNMLTTGSTETGNDGLPFPNQSQIAMDYSFNEGNEDVYLQDFAIKWDTSIMSLNMGVEAGRIGVKVSPLIFQRADVTPYFVNDRWDNGKYYFDGANVSLKFSSAKVNIFAGRDNPSEGGTVGFNTLQPLIAFNSGLITWTGGLPINQQLGVTAGLPLGANGNLNLAYIWLSSNTVSGGANGVNVYGGDASFNAGGFKLDGAYSKSDVVYNTHTIVNKKNDAYWVNVSRDFGKWGAKVGYRQINPFFGAPGDWGRVGIFWNPTDIKGITADAHLDISDSTKLVANGQFYTGTNNGGSLGTSDKLNSIVVGLSHRMGTANTVDLGVESVTLSGPSFNVGSGNPFQRWYNIGFSHKISDNSMFRMLWQISDFDAKGGGTDPITNAGDINPGVQKGGLLTTQLSVKF